MKLIDVVLTEKIAGITELRVNPMKVICKAKGKAIAIVNQNKVAFYAVPPRLFENMLEQIDNYELEALARQAIAEGGEDVSVNLQDL